jgi:hypothetical protein
MRKKNDNKPWQLAAISMLLVAAYYVQAAECCATSTEPVDCGFIIGAACNSTPPGCPPTYGTITASGTNNKVNCAGRGVEGYWADSNQQHCTGTCHVARDCNGAPVDTVADDGQNYTNWTMSDEECYGSGGGPQ